MLLELMSLAAFWAQSHGTGTFLTKLFGPGAAPGPGGANLSVDHKMLPDGPASYAV